MYCRFTMVCGVTMVIQPGISCGNTIKFTPGTPYGFLGMVIPHGVWHYHGVWYTMQCGITIPKKPYGVPGVTFMVLPCAIFCWVFPKVWGLERLQTAR